MIDPWTAIAETTPPTLTPRIRKKLAKHFRARPRFLKVEPVEGAEPLHCYPNVKAAIEKHGGRMIEGWMVWESALGHYLKLVHHAVWRKPNGKLRDVTPSEGDALTLFVPDYSVRFAGGRIPPRYIQMKHGPEAEEITATARMMGS